jgi:Glycosyl transferase family 2.
MPGKAPRFTPGCKPRAGQFLVLIDGDLQNDPADIPKLVGEISRGADLVCGYRAQRRDTRVNGSPAGLRTPFAAVTRKTACATPVARSRRCGASA